MMKRQSWPVLGLALLVVSLVGGAGMADGTWISADGKNHDLKGKNVHFFGEGEGSEFDLADLAEGEVRSFGVGDRQFTATRSGDVVTLTREAAGEAGAMNMTCDVARDSCMVVTFDDSERVLLKIQKTRVCENGEGDCGHAQVHAIHAGHPGDGNVFLHKIVACEGAPGEDCEDVDIRTIHSGAAETDGEMVVFRSAGAGAGDAVIEIRGDDRTLRCPEGDSTIRVEPDEVGEIFLCPKHSVPMERAQQAAAHVIIERKSK